MTHKLQELIDALIRRDREGLQQCDVYSIDSRVELANDRAKDALMALCEVCRYIIGKEQS